jgi:hypothetical protein
VTTKSKPIVTTVRLTKEQYDWLRRQAFRAALIQGGRPDASAIIQKLIDKARRHDNKELL